MIQWISTMIPLVCLAYQAWNLMQNEGSKWSGKIDKSQLKILPLCWSWPSKLYINTAHNKLGYCTACALCVPRSLKEDSKNLCFEIALSHFQWFKEDRNEFLESTVTGDRTLVQHMKQNKLEWSGDTQLPRQQHEEICRTRPGHMRSDPLVWKCNPTQHTLDTWVIAVISLGTSCFLHPI